MPCIPHSSLRSSLPAIRRAHLVLSFLLHFYVHTAPPDPLPLSIPLSLSAPLTGVSDLLGLPPVVTYADTVLYNVQPLRSDRIPSLPYNPPHHALTTFTGTRSEEQFFVISAVCEMAGAAALRLMRRSLDELFLADNIALQRLTHHLRRLALQIDRIGDITMSMIHEIDPEEFYHLIRPWFRGGDANGPDSLGWLFETTDVGATAAILWTKVLVRAPLSTPLTFS